MNHKYRYGGRVANWRTGVLSLTILMCAMLSYYGNQDNTYTREHKEVVASKTVHASTTEEKIAYYFPKHKATMIAVAKAESHMNMNAVGYNCFYYQGKATTTPIKGGSKSCNVEDRKLAHSVDCFVLQKNYPGRKSCPKGVTLEKHLEEVSRLSKLQGLESWSSYNNKSYLKYLATNN